MSSRLMYRAELIVRESAGAMYQARSVWYIAANHRQQKAERGTSGAF